MNYSFTRSSDGLITMRNLMVEPDVPTVYWYLNRIQNGVDRPIPTSSFARSRKRRRTAKERSPNEVGRLQDYEINDDLRKQVRSAVSDMRGGFSPEGYLRIEKVTPGQGPEVHLDGVSLESRRLKQMLDGCDECALFLCSLGTGVDEPINSAYEAGDERRGRICEAVASSALLNLTQRFQRRIEAIARVERLRVTHCQWPGFCDWPAKQAVHLLPRLGAGQHGRVAWRKEGFDPAWCFLGVIGLGRNVSRIKNNPCRSCDKRKECSSRIW